MARPARVPDALTHGPFTLEEAARHGVSRRQLQGETWRRLGRGLYIHAEVDCDPLGRLTAILRRLPAGAVFSGLTAAWLHGLEARFPGTIAVTVPSTSCVAAKAGVEFHKGRLERRDVVTSHGLPATSIARTLFDLAAALPLVEATVLVDTALHAKVVKPAELERRLRSEAGRPGSLRFRNVLEHAEPKSESPMETRLRMLLVLAGLPRPQVQVNLRDRFGITIARADLYYPERKLCIEFDGGNHRDRMVDDNRRQNRLLGAGYTLLRFTTPDLKERPDAIVAEVGRALG